MRKIVLHLSYIALVSYASHFVGRNFSKWDANQCTNRLCAASSEIKKSYFAALVPDQNPTFSKFHLATIEAKERNPFCIDLFFAHPIKSGVDGMRTIPGLGALLTIYGYPIFLFSHYSQTDIITTIGPEPCDI